MPFDAQQTSAAILRGDDKLAKLGAPARVWAIGSLYGRYGALCHLHEILAPRLKPRDRIIYLGNYLGGHTLWAGEGIAVFDELIDFRNALIAIPGIFARDIVFLRGQHEALFLELLRLPFQRNPQQWLQRALHNGLECYLDSYGIKTSLYHVVDQGLIAINRWVSGCRQHIRRFHGHDAFLHHLNSGAVTHYPQPWQMAFVPNGIDPRCPLHLQFDSLLWPEADIAKQPAWNGYSRLVRGKAHTHAIPAKNDFVLSLDDGDGLGGRIYAACLDPQGKIIDMLTA